MAKNKTLLAAQKAYNKGKSARATQKKKGVVTTQKPAKKKTQKKAQPKQQTPTYAQKAFSRGQKAQATAKKNKVVTTKQPTVKQPQVTKTKPKVTNTSLAAAKKAYNKGKDITYLGTKQKTTTTKVGNTKLKSVNALTKSEMNRVIAATPYGKKKGNILLKGGKRTGQSDIREKVGSKTAESAYKSKAATGVMQGMSKVDVFSGGVGTYNKQAKKAIKKTKESTAYNVGYGVGMAADMGIGGVSSKGASAANAIGKGAGKLLGKGAAKQAAKTATKEAAKETAKTTGKESAKRFAKNRAGELVAETPTNVLDAAKMSMDSEGKLDKKEFKKWLAVNTGLTAGTGGAIEGIGAAATKRLGNKTIDLLAKQQAGTITRKETEQLGKNISKLKGKAGNNAVSGDIASNAVTDIKKSAQEARINKRLEQIKAQKAKTADPKVIRRLNAEESVAQEAKQALAKQAENVTAEVKAQATTPKNTAPKGTKSYRTNIEVNKHVKKAVKGEGSRADIEKGLNDIANELGKKNNKTAKRKALELAQKHINVEKEYTDFYGDKNLAKAHTEAKKNMREVAIDLSGFSGNVNKVLENVGFDKKTIGSKIKFRKNGGRSIEQAYHDLQERMPEAFPDDITNEEDMLRRMCKVATEGREKYYGKQSVPLDDRQIAQAYTEKADELLESARKILKSKPDPKTPKQEAEEALAKAMGEYDQLAKQGGIIGNNLKAARAVNSPQVDSIKASLDRIDQAKIMKQDEIARLQENVKKAENEQFANKGEEYLPDSIKGMEIPFTGKLSAAAQKSIDDVTEIAEKEYKGELKAPKNMESDGVLRATTKGKEGARKGWQVVREALVDNYASLEDIAKTLPDEMRNKMLAQINEFRRATKTGRAVVAEKGRKIYQDAGLTKRGKATEVKRNEFEEYCFLKHELDRKKAGNNFTNLSRADIDARLNELESKYWKTDKNGVVIKDKDGNDINEIVKFQKEMRDYFDELLEREVDAGITTAEDAARIRKLYPNYVPTYKPSEFDQMLKRQTKDEIDVGRGLKAATGGEHDLVPLFNQMQVKTNVVLKRTELNKTLNLLCMASGTTKKELEDISPFFANKQDEDKLLDLLDSQVFTKEREGKHIATMYFDGAPIDISIDKEVYDAIRRWSGEDRKWIVFSGLIDNKATTWVNSQFKKWITDYNIFFGIKNFKRDLATALFYTKDIKGYVKNLPKAMAACWLPDKMLTKEMKVYKEAFKTYKENGGVISQFIARDSATTTFFDSTRKFNILKWVENFNSSLETVPRMAEFISTMDSKALKAAGKEGNYAEEFRKLLNSKDDVAEAMYRAKDVTLNFDRSGWLGAKINRGVVPFFNPAIQGLDKLGRKLITDNIKYGGGKIAAGDTIRAFLKTGVALTSMVAFPTYAWDKLFGDYINGEVEGYEKQSDYNRYAYYLLPVGDGKFVKIPKTRELASLQAPIDFVYDNMKFGSGSTWQRLFGDQSFRDLKSMGRISWEQVGTVNPLTDNIISPAVNTYRGKTWYGGDIESFEDQKYREEGKLYRIWDEDTSGLAKYIGKQFNMSPKKVDNILDSYTGIFYDMVLKQTSAKNSLKGESPQSAAVQILSSQFSTNFMVDSVFQNANKSDYYAYAHKRDEKLAELKEGSPEYIKLKAEMSKDKNAFAYTSATYDELVAQIYLDKNLSRKEKNKYARILKANQNAIWGDRKKGRVTASRDPMADIWNMKSVDGKRIMSTKKIIDSCSFTFKNGNNTIKDAYNLYHKNGGKSDVKFMEVTLSARDVNRAAGDSMSSPRWEVIAYATELNNIKGSDKVVASYIEKESTRKRYTENAKIYKEFGFTIKNYKTTRKTMTQGAYDLGYDYVRDMRDGELAMVLSNARTQKGAKYRDGAYQANDFYILNRMNGARCLDHKRNGSFSAKEVKDFCDKYKLNHKDDYSWDVEKVTNAINAAYGSKSTEVKAALFNVITGYTYKNPFGSIGDYSLATDTGIYCSGGYTGYGRRRRGWHRWGHGGGGGRGSAYTAVLNTAGSKSKVTNTSKTNTSTKSNLDDAYRKKLKKLRENARSN